MLQAIRQLFSGDYLLSIFFFFFFFFFFFDLSLHSIWHTLKNGFTRMFKTWWYKSAGPQEHMEIDASSCNQQYDNSNKKSMPKLTKYGTEGAVRGAANTQRVARFRSRSRFPSC